MREGKKHMGKNSRVSIEEGVRAGKSCRSIALSLNVSPSTVSREVRNNRTVVEPPRRDGAKMGVRCARYRECQVVGGACGECRSLYVRCRECRTRSCIDSCPGFVPRMCEKTERWPFVCPGDCPKRRRCNLPNVSVNTLFTISTSVFSPNTPSRFRRPRHRGCAASG